MTDAIDSIQIVTFRLANNNEIYAIPIKEILEIRTLETITFIPNMKPYVKGIINLRGKVIPIIDVKEKLEIAPNDADVTKQRILVVTANENHFGLLVDEVQQVVTIQNENVDPVPQNTLRSKNYIQGIIKMEHSPTILVDVRKFLDVPQMVVESK